MKKSNILLVSLLVLIVGAGSFWLKGSIPGFASAGNGGKAEIVSYQKKIKYRFEVSNPKNEVLHDTQLTIAIPAELSKQKISKIDVSHPHQIVVDAHGNQTAQLTIEKLIPYQTQQVTVVITLATSEGVVESQPENLSEYLHAERYIDASHQDIVTQARELRSTQALDTAKAVFDWEKDYLKYAGYIADDRGALYALHNKLGDCTEYMYLYGAVMRANNIPTRMMSGFVVDSNKVLAAADYHNWAEVYIDGRWRVVDPQKEVFMSNEHAYVVMRVLSAGDRADKSGFENSQQLVRSSGLAKVAML